MDAARAQVGRTYYFAKADARLPKGRYFIDDLLGCEVKDADNGTVYGTLTEVDHPAAQDIYTVTDAAGEKHMLPAVPEFVKTIDIDARTILGPAFTVRVPQGDNLMFHAAMDLAKPGDVIVIDAGGFDNRAIFGELMATYCKSRGIAGIVCNGAVRDSAALAEMEDFPVYACGVTPNGPYKNGPGEIGVPVVIGGKTVYPGDIIVGDEDGVLAIRPAEAEALAAATQAVQEKENKIMEHIVQDGTYIRPWVDEKLKEIGCEYV